MPLYCCFCHDYIKENKFKTWLISAQISSDSVCTNTNDFPTYWICLECFIQKYIGYGKMINENQDQQAESAICSQRYDLQLQILSAVIDDLEKPEGNCMMVKHNIQIIPLWIAKFQKQIETYHEYLNNIKDFLKRREPPVVDLTCNMMAIYNDLPLKFMSCSKSQLEIIGVIETMDEDLQHLVLAIVHYIDVNIQLSDLKNITRAKSGTDGYPRSIVFGFTQTLKKEEFLQKWQENEPIYSENIAELNNIMPNVKLFVSNRLDTSHYELFRDCRRTFQNSVTGYWRIVDNETFVWVSGDQENNTTHTIKDNDDLALVRTLESLNLQQ